MMRFQKIYLGISEIALLLILGILPFSYKTINTQWIVFFSILLGICVFMHVSKKIRPENYRIWRVFFALLFMIIFDIAEKVNIVRHIPLSTVFIAIAMLALMINIIFQAKVKMIYHSFMLYFFYACAFLFILTVLFYPFFLYHYQMQQDSNIHLFSKMVKYAILFILVVNYLSDKKKFKIMNLSLILSLSIIIILSILL